MSYTYQETVWTILTSCVHRAYNGLPNYLVDTRRDSTNSRWRWQKADGLGHEGGRDGGGGILLSSPCYDRSIQKEH
ncbi:hypothetical protein L6452_28905 [Arctium lappa]|uniref:Uncharacterized protein n=1 Tax=Arctium lappa TaxID=4217 RepID=A0ACB9A0K0_ARCLA|nr:hypothetical protein L6452_28905 [Arctium lappa]